MPEMEMPGLPKVSICHCRRSGLMPLRGPCGCPPTEALLRGYMWGAPLPTMTADQREWCFAQIDRVEGYCRGDYKDADDGRLANGVLDAWTDFCQDKGLL
jgi:hypothetical protein